MRSVLMSLNANIVAGIPPGSKLYGCDECSCLWVDSSVCFICHAEGFVIVKPIKSNGMQVERPKNSLLVNGTHYADDENIILLIKDALKYI